MPVVVQFIVDHAARRPDGEGAVEDTSSSADQVGKSELTSDSKTLAAGRAAPKKVQKRRVLTVLVTELPEHVDAALVTGGYKGKQGPPALAFLVHRIALLSKAHQMAQAGRTGHSGFEDALASPAAGRRWSDERAATLQGTSSAGESGGRLANPCADPLLRDLPARLCPARRAAEQAEGAD